MVGLGFEPTTFRSEKRLKVFECLTQLKIEIIEYEKRASKLRLFRCKIRTAKVKEETPISSKKGSCQAEEILETYESCQTA